MNQFESLTPAEKRVAIAKDVLAQLAADRLKALRGYWVRVDTDKLPGSYDEIVSSGNCQTCAIGSLFVSLGRLKGLTPSQHLTKGSSVFDETPTYDARVQEVLPILRDYFDAEQLYLMENAFEGDSPTFLDRDDTDFNPLSVDEDLVQAARLFGGIVLTRYGEPDEEESPAADEVLRLIMENVVANGGEFNPLK